MLVVIYTILLVLLLLLVFIISFNKFVQKPQGSKLVAGLEYNIYKTKDGKAYFFFRYVSTRYGYEIDIMSQPSYRGRYSDAMTVHKLPSSRPDCYHIICVSGYHMPQTEEDAKRLSMDWAELTWNYIKTGETIDQQIAKRG